VRQGSISTKASPARAGILALAALLLALVLASPARAERALLSEHAVDLSGIGGGNVEDACGLAFKGENAYVSYYYEHLVYLLEPGEEPVPIEADPLDGPCQLAVGPSGALYTNDWHRRVERLRPTPLVFDSNESTGVAVDPASGDVYVNDRTYIAVYEPSGSPVMEGSSPLQIGLGSLVDAYGVAFFDGRVYVPDAGSDTVKVFDLATNTKKPALTIDGSATPQSGFSSLMDGAVAVDPSSEHILVLDNLQPHFEHPQAAIDEFDATGTFLGQVKTKVVDAEPSALVFEGGNLFVTSGNSERSSVFEFGPYSASASLSAPLATPRAAAAGATAAAPAGGTSRRSGGGAGATASQIVQGKGTRVKFDGKLAPNSLPRSKQAPIKVSVSARISSAKSGAQPAQLRTISLAINRYGHLNPQGLPVCSLRAIQPSTTEEALATCRRSLVGEGRFSAKVLFAQQSPFPASGKVYAFNSSVKGKPAILAHVYGTNPVPTSFTLVFIVSKRKGTFGTVLTASLPEATGNSAYVTGLSLDLGKQFSSHGKSRSYLTAACPAPKGAPSASFSLAQAKFGFGKQTLTSTLSSLCRVSG
jgi:DNA-binding beta-propeller fold protein YncE